ncbi:phosphatidylinositol N-acetylglucosaminyltransferase [Thelephora terrestris]|uniref:Phosphatidylinositol N-acetylglucosaminyltransferase n=1 Tax=Thelephora terrestris TaxID=56493 RepID=A0A9P6HFD9_9AGAM|nr:phosphatidylinositol N-acetylglucosaminyltransferase [Thelephora terrestris]
MSDKQWEQVLWKRQPFPDNYVPPSFLSSLRRNSNFRPYSYWKLVSLCYPIAQHICTIFIFLATFVRIKERMLDPRLLVWASIFAFALGYLVWQAVEIQLASKFRQVRKPTNHAKTVKSSILAFLALLSLSPVMKTLTASTSSDSIWAIAACLFILNALIANYSSPRPEIYTRESLTSVLSINAAISASVVLASRLPDDISVFALMLYAVVLFAMFPVLRHRLQAASSGFQAFLTVLLSAISVLLTAPLSPFVAWIYGGVLSLVLFAAPAALVWAQRYKNELKGSWDVAVPRVNRRRRGKSVAMMEHLHQRRLGG